MTGERLDRNELPGSEYPIVAKLKGENEFILSFDFQLKDYMSTHWEDVELDIPSRVAGSKEEIIKQILQGQIVMYVEFDLEDENFSNVILRAFEDSEEGEWWSFVFEQQALQELYVNYGDEYNTVREFYALGVNCNAVESDQVDEAWKNVQEFRRKFGEDHPEDDETVERLAPLLAEITNKFLKPAKQN